MKKFLRTLALVLTLVFTLSSVAFSAFAAEFTDYYETPEYYFGDTDFDGRITVKDATALQKHLAKIITLSEAALYFGDVDGNGKNTISDATLIQKYVANMIYIFPVEDVGSYYEYTADGTTLDVEFTAYGFAEIQVTVEESGFYDFSAAVVEGSDIYFDITSENTEDYWFAESDGESSYAFAKLEAGVYYVYMSTFGESDAVVQFKAGLSEYEAPFEIDEAVELKAGDKVEVKAGTDKLVYKVNNNDLEFDGDMYFIYTEGDDPCVDLMCYDENYTICGESEIDIDGKNVVLYVYGSYYESDPWSYIVVNQAEGGSDFTLCCETTITMLEKSAVDIELNSTEEIAITVYTEEIDGEEMSVYFSEAAFRFIPEASGYYSLNFVSTTDLSVMSAVASLDDIDNSLGFLDYSEEGLLTDVQYLEADKEYYIVVIVFLSEEGEVQFTLKESNEDEYNKAHEDDYIDDSTYDEIEYTELSVGDTVTVELDGVEEFYKDFVLTATEDSTIVIYSEGSTDAYLDIFDAEGMSLFFSDDIFVADSSDFAVIGTISAGETIYIGVGSWSETGDSFTFSVVSEADYTPIA